MDLPGLQSPIETGEDIREGALLDFLFTLTTLPARLPALLPDRLPALLVLPRPLRRQSRVTKQQILCFFLLFLAKL